LTTAEKTTVDFLVIRSSEPTDRRSDWKENDLRTLPLMPEKGGREEKRGEVFGWVGLAG